ncbi:hypothetical protein DM860_004305 [Cuscuta australis]|uniref:Purple acid phosphatase n=1 Tax=Cuscuta australis TaxID=267555 RepID=A0A328E771_9ASTE|nr:hypothetical protein DM860_004305 [Cuscuta australis]
MKLLSPSSFSPPSSIIISPRLTLLLLLRILSCIFFFFAIFDSAAAHSSARNHSGSLMADDIVADAAAAAAAFRNATAISEFRLLNRKYLLNCTDINPYIKLSIKRPSGDDYSDGQLLPDEELVTVQVDGVLFPSPGDWVALVSTSHSDVSGCLLSKLKYSQTGDFSKLPLLCHYPVKAQYLSSDPDYLNRKKKKCIDKLCLLHTYSATLTFHVINFRTEIEFVLFAGGFETPCILKRSTPLNFSNPSSPLYPHLSSIDSTATSMRVTWVSGDKMPQQVRYDNGRSQTSEVTTFTQDQMCSSIPKSPAIDFGWHDPGYAHSAVMTGLNPSTTYTYTLGSDSIGWSSNITFKTAPAGGSDELRFIVFGDMGKAPRDNSIEHYIQPGSLSVVDAMEREISAGKVDSVFHIGDISYATGFLVEWDYFLHLITPVASRVPYMTAIGNHEIDYIGTGSVYKTPDSGGECGIPYETYFQMPTQAKDKPWYSIEQGSVHFTVISTENDFFVNSEQYEWMKRDMGAIDRERTPWLIFTGHRPMYSSISSNETQLIESVDNNFVHAIEPLLLENEVDIALWGHVHKYERTCAVYGNQCKAMPVKGGNGEDTYVNNSAPVHVIIGMAGYSLDPSPSIAEKWSLVRISEYGYARLHATKKDLKFEFVNAATGIVRDSFRITKNIGK